MCVSLPFRCGQEIPTSEWLNRNTLIAMLWEQQSNKLVWPFFVCFFLVRFMLLLPKNFSSRYCYFLSFFSSPFHTLTLWTLFLFISRLVFSNQQLTQNVRNTSFLKNKTKTVSCIAWVHSKNSKFQMSLSSYVNNEIKQATTEKIGYVYRTKKKLSCPTDI